MCQIRKITIGITILGWEFVKDSNLKLIDLPA
jgi:hypothetical protein